MDVAGKKVAMLVFNYFEQAEFEEPLATLKDAGVIVTVVAADNKQLYGMHHVDKGDKFQADALLKDATPNEYDALVLPGGVVNADALRMIGSAQTWAANFLEQGKPVAAICHAPWLLVSADVVEGRRLTSYHTLQDDIRNAGGEWIDQAVVVDESLITSRKPDDITAFCDALLGKLAAQPPDPDDPDPELENDVPPTPLPLDEKDEEDESRLRALGNDPARDRLSRTAPRNFLASF